MHPDRGSGMVWQGLADDTLEYPGRMHDQQHRYVASHHQCPHKAVSAGHLQQQYQACQIPRHISVDSAVEVMRPGIEQTHEVA